MPKETIKFPSDPHFNDYLYTLLFNMEASQKRHLKGKHLKAVMTERGARNFIANASLEDKLYLLSCTGQKFFITLMAEDFKKEWFKEIYDLFQKDKKPAALKDLVSRGLFVSSDVNFTRLLGHVSRSIHHHNFYQATELRRTGFHIRKWKRIALGAKDLETREADEAATSLAQLLLSGSVTMDYMKGLMGISATEMKLLLYLYTNSHAYTSEKYLGSFFKGYIRDAEVRLSIRNLCKSGYVEADKVPEKRYTITGPGTKMVNEYYKIIFTKLNT